MGNRAVITTPARGLALYLHWNGGRDTVAPLLKYCELHNYRPPSSDCYGWARMCQVMGNYIGGGLSIGIDSFSSLGNQGDNGVYVIDGWQIVGRETYEGYVEQEKFDFDEMLRAFDKAMPRREQLGAYLDHVTIATDDLVAGDKLWWGLGEGNAPRPYMFHGFAKSPCRHGTPPSEKEYRLILEDEANPGNLFTLSFYKDTCAIMDRKDNRRFGTDAHSQNGGNDEKGGGST